MKGDFTRFTFDSDKRFARVLTQQGRVSLDSDWNEAAAIQAYLAQTRTQDVIGLCGVPKDNAGMGVTPTPDGNDLQLSAGHIYINGQLAQVGEGVTYGAQPHLPNPPAINPAHDRRDLVYVDMWQRHVTAVEQPDLLEKALGGADTTTRLQTIWQVRTLTDVTATSCDELTDELPILPPLSERGRLNNGTTGSTNAGDPCLIADGGGYRGLENRLYRVEIHDGGAPLIFPRPAGVNGVAVSGISQDELTVTDAGNFRIGQAVELYSDETDAGNDVGLMARITAIAGNVITLSQDAASLAGDANLQLRTIATCKWSRDNGSIVFPIAEFVAGEPTKVRVKRLGRDQVLTVRVGDFVEVLGDTTELNGAPGTMSFIAPNGIDEAELILTLGADIAEHNGEAYPKVRRWDQGELAIPIDAGMLELENGITVQFGGDNFVAGDYWTFAARTADGSIEILTDAPPQGVEHNYCPLALLHWQAITDSEDQWAATIVEDCRPTFPPLTKICAEDVCYDNEICEDIQATNVQEALDQLCAQRDLRHHNKHLHGWGIVCGLQVHCGDDDIDEQGDRVAVIVRPGYALDCDGNDILLDEEMSVDVLKLIRAYEAENPNQPLLIDGAGEICLVIGRNDRGQPAVELRPYNPNRKSLQSALKDTFWMDVFRDCIQEPIEKLRDILTPDNDDGNSIPVSPGRRQMIALLNLVIQFINPQYGSHIFISRKEDAILQLVYQLIRALLQSKTFCAMFENARPFPKYPFEKDLQMSTIFDLTLRTRLRIHPKGHLGFGVGYDDRIHVYDLPKEELIAQLDIPGGSGLIVRDVALSQDGSQIYAVGTLRDEDSILAPGKIDDAGNVEWGDIQIVCEGLLTTMIRMPDSKNALLAVAEGRGLYIIDPENITPNAEPNVAFNASGQLAANREAKTLFVGANSDGEEAAFAATFDRIHEINWETQNIVRTFQLPEAYTGEDDIALMPAINDMPATLFVVTISTQNQKEILAYRGNESIPSAKLNAIGNTAIRLQPLPNRPLMAVTYEDYYLLSLIDTVKLAATEYQLPVQISPIGMAISNELQTLYVVNGISQTINNIHLSHLTPTGQDGPLPPGLPQFMEAMRRYRSDVIAAYLDLAGGMLQYIKDCVCDHLLVNCPSCDEDDEIYLGCISIRGEEVYKACNFSQRKYVHSFPTVEYWLSTIPILPLVDYMVEQLCCLILPHRFGQIKVPGHDSTRSASLQGKQARGGFSYYKSGNIGLDVRQALGQVTLARGLTGDWLGARLNQVTAAPSLTRRQAGMVRHKDLYNQPVAEATRRAEAANVTVAEVEPYDPALGLRNLRKLDELPASMPPGQTIKLYQKDGIVRYYSVVKSPAVKGLIDKTPASKVTELEKQIVSMETELAELRTFREEVQAFMAKNNS